MKSRPIAALAPLLLLVAWSPQASALTRYHVDAAATPGGDGLTWGTAFPSLDDALALAVVGDKIWVKAGTYTPAVEVNPGDPRSATFFLGPGITLRGGFDGTETQLSQRAGLFDQTILTGEIGVPGDPTDNAYRVVTALHPSGIPPGVVRIDGFTIRDGHGVGGMEKGGGVAMFNVGLWLTRCTIRDNTARWGAGLHAQPAAANLRWCKFIDNHALERGGGIWGQSIDYRVSHCEFRGNSAGRGGAIYVHSISGSAGVLPRVIVHNSILVDNSAERGGAVYIGGGQVASGKITLSSCTVAFNRATLRGGGVHAVTGTQVPAESTLINSIVWANRAPQDPNLRGRHEAHSSNIQDGTFHGTMNLSLAPGFVSPLERDLRLRPGSPCNDTGSNVLLPYDFLDADEDGDSQEDSPIDLDGKRRIKDDPDAAPFGQLLDMGAYER